MHYEKFPDGTVKCIEDEIPFELPEGWSWCRLFSLSIKIGAGSTPTGGAVVYTTSGIKFIRSQNVYDDGLLLDDVAYIPEEINQKKSGSIVKSKDILLNITGGSIGRCSLVSDDFDVANVNQHVMIIRLANLELRKYIHSVVISPYIQEQIISRQVGSGRGGLSAETLSTFLIPLPPLNEQVSINRKLNECISQVLAIADAKCNISNLIIATKSKILDLAIRGKLVPQDPNDEPASVLLERIRSEKEELIKQGKIKRDKKESVIFKGDDNSYYLRTGGVEESLENWRFDDLPETWKICCLGELCDYGDCINVNTEDIAEDAWILDLEDIEKDTGMVLKKVTKAQRNSVSTKHKFHSGQVLYSKLRPYLNKVVLSDADGYCTSEILPLEFKNCVLPEYARYYLMSGTFITYANHCSYGVKMPRLGTTDGKKAIFSLPPLSEQKCIVETIDFCFMQLNKISEALA
ncbi:MAG: restriction endonuclease subunit S [Lachnospira eligens]